MNPLTNSVSAKILWRIRFSEKRRGGHTVVVETVGDSVEEARSDVKLSRARGKSEQAFKAEIGSLCKDSSFGIQHF